MAEDALVRYDRVPGLAAAAPRELERVAGAGPARALVPNHPSGDPTPSPDDLHLTAEAVAAGRLLGIAVLDHLVIGHGDWMSLRDRGVDFDPGLPATGVAEGTRILPGLETEVEEGFRRVAVARSAKRSATRAVSVWRYRCYKYAPGRSVAVSHGGRPRQR